MKYGLLILLLFCIVTAKGQQETIEHPKLREFLESKNKHGIIAGIEGITDNVLSSSGTYYIGYYYRGLKPFQLSPMVKLGFMPQMNIGGGRFNFFTFEPAISPGFYSKFFNFKVITAACFFIPLNPNTSDFPPPFIKTTGLSLMPSPGISFGKINLDSYFGLMSEVVNLHEFGFWYMRAGLSLGYRIK